MVDAKNGYNRETRESEFQFEISLSVLNHLGRNLYRSFITVLGEAISNAWDAEAENVYITIDRENGIFTIRDDGDGMNKDDFQNKFLKIGYSKRKELGQISFEKNRPFIGAKGIGKLALLSCAEEITVVSKAKNGELVGGVINNVELDDAIDEDLTPQDYPLKQYSRDIAKSMDSIEKGTLIHFSGTKDKIRNTIDYIRKQIALYFRFSLVDPQFNIFVEGELISFDDISKLSNATEFVWQLNEFKDPYIEQLSKLKEGVQELNSEFGISGFVATVEFPKDVKILGADEKVTIDLFVNGRLRERDIVKHIPTNRLIESYWYGQIHYNGLDADGVDRFTSSREGIKSEDDLFRGVLAELKSNVLNKILDQWDKLRLDRGKDGDDENTGRKSKIERRANSLFSLAADNYRQDNSNLIEQWIKELRPDSEFNVPAYVDCYISENLVRKYIHHKNIPVTSKQKQIDDFKEAENKRKIEGNISYQIRQHDDDLSYLDLSPLSLVVQESYTPKNDPHILGLLQDSRAYRPIRNAVGHTGLVTSAAKAQLKLVFENIRSKLKILIK